MSVIGNFGNEVRLEDEVRRLWAALEEVRAAETVTLEHHLATVAMVRTATLEQAASFIEGCADAWAQTDPDDRFSANNVATKLESIAKAVALLKVWPS